MNSTAVIVLALPALCLVLGLIFLVVWASQTLVETGRKREVWQNFAQRIGGQFTPASGGQPEQVVASIKEWPFYLDTYVVGDGHSLVQYTRMRAFYPPKERLELTVYNANAHALPMLDRHAKLQKIDVTELGFGPEIVVRSTDEIRARTVLMGDEMRRLIKQTAPALQLEVRRRRNWQNGGVSSSVYEVHLQQAGVTTDMEQLTALYALLAYTLEHLRQQGIAGDSFADVL